MYYIYIISIFNYIFIGNFDGIDFIIIIRNYMYKIIIKFLLFFGKNYYFFIYNYKLWMKYFLFIVNLENVRLKFYKIK